MELWYRIDLIFRSDSRLSSQCVNNEHMKNSRDKYSSLEEYADIQKLAKSCINYEFLGLDHESHFRNSFSNVNRCR